MEERGVTVGGRGFDIRVVVHALLGGAEGHREEVTGVLDGVVHTGGGERLGQGSAQLGAAGIQGLVDLLIGQGQGRNAGGYRQRVTREGAGLVDRADRGQVLHDAALTGQGRDGHAAADDLAEGENIGNPAAVLGGGVAPVTGRGDAETGQHLVKDDERAVGVGNLVQAAVEAGFGGDHAHVAGGRLGDDGGNLTLVGFEGLAHGVQVVIGQNNGLGGGRGSHASRTRQRQGCHARTGLGEQRIHVAVVAASKLNDLVAAGHTAGQANRGHGRLGTCGHHAHLLNRAGNRGVNAVDDQLGQLRLGGARRTEGQAARGGLLNGLHDLRVRVAQNRRAPGADQVNVLVAVRVVQVGALSLRRKRRSAAHGVEGAHRGVHAAGNHRAGTLE